MQQLTMLVTPDAQWVLPDSPEFLEALGDPEADYDSIAFAVKNLGFIKFQVLQRSIVELELHPHNVELPALLAVQQEILRSEVQLFRIKFFDTAWRSEISSSREHVVARLSELCAPIFAPVPTERFHVELQDVSKVFDDEDNWLRPLAQKWRVSFGNFDPSVISLALTHGLLSRLMIVGVKPRVQEPVWRFIGDGHQWIGNDFRLRGIGEKMENMPDKEYGRWVTSFYKTVASSGQPRYDHVTGTIQWEDEDGRPRRLYRYERLMLPWKTPSGEVFVTMCSRPLGKTIDSGSTSVSSMIAPLDMKSAMSA
ncbi:MAG TPA: hypothetical protein VKQ73_15380 [Stellaceae bacterium]|nr:hypothetical protein [Stellaceae bacterium]